MRNGFDSYTRFTVFGFGWANSFAIRGFSGITELEVVAGGCLMAMFPPFPNTVTYNVYVRPNNPNVFEPEYLLGKYPNLPLSTNYYGDTVIKVKIRTEVDPNVLLQDTKMYYVGIRTENELGIEDNNTEVLNVRPLGTGQAYVFVNDRHISIVS